MRRHLWLAVAMLLVGMGCPEEFGIGGRIDKAAAHDTKENLEEQKALKKQVKEKGQCPAGMHLEKPVSPCPNPPCEPTCVADKSDD